MSTYEPGTVAVATVRGVPNVRVMCNEESWGPVWTSATPTAGKLFRHYECDVTDIRPLVVLDPATSPEPLNSTFAATFLDAAAEIVEKSTKRKVREVPFLRWLADQIEEQTKPPFVPRFRLGGLVRFTGSPTESEPWTKRRTEKHLGIVVENFGDGEVRIYDTVEHDWWQCDETRLAPFEDGAS